MLCWQWRLKSTYRSHLNVSKLVSHTLYFFWGENFHKLGIPKKSSAKCTKGFLENKCKSQHNLENEFLELTRRKQGSKKLWVCWLTSSQIWLIPLVEDCQSTNLAKLKKNNPAQSPVIKCSNGGRVHKLEDHIWWPSCVLYRQLKEILLTHAVSWVNWFQLVLLSSSKSFSAFPSSQSVNRIIICEKHELIAQFVLMHGPENTWLSSQWQPHHLSLYGT
jgi:hypothetical protein